MTKKKNYVCPTCNTNTYAWKDRKGNINCEACDRAMYSTDGYPD